MKFYLSSYKIGNEIDKLKQLTKNWNKKIAYISNALDWAENTEKANEHRKEDISLLEKMGFSVEPLDLRNYFNKETYLLNKIKEYSIIWVSWWNCFVLRQAFKLSWFDNILNILIKENTDILYWWYSAGICILAPSLNGLDIIDNTTRFPYPNQSEQIYDGLWILDFSIVPHYKPNHPEAEYYISHKILFKAISDWEVLIIE
jgi:dipeptidase E